MQQIADALGLQLPQIIANIIGFAVFLWLMAKYAWKPFLNFMDERREEIAGSFRKIDEERAETKIMRDDYQSRIDTIDDEATRRINEAIRRGEEAARLIEDQAREKARKIIEKSEEDIGRIAEQARLDLKNYVVNLGVEAGRKAAMEVLDETAHRRLVERFVEELSNVR
jgi:F-type H+-transporting ATPase subunit b